MHSLESQPLISKEKLCTRKEKWATKIISIGKTWHDLEDVNYLIIDEFSVIGQNMFGWINRRCRPATSISTVPFGGMSIILVGDIAQLPPITDQVLYHTKPKSELAVEGYCMYKNFDTVVKFEINEKLGALMVNNSDLEVFK